MGEKEYQDWLNKQEPSADAKGAAANIIGATVDGPVNPDKTAKLYENSLVAGVPYAAASGDSDYFNENFEQQKRIKISEESPALQSYIAKNPAYAPTSWDDMEHLGLIDKALLNWRLATSEEYTLKHLSTGGAGITSMQGPMDPQALEMINRMREQEEKLAKVTPGLGWQILRGAANMLGKFGSDLPEELTGAVSGAAAGTAVPVPILGTISGAGAGFFVGTGVAEAQKTLVKKKIEAENWIGPNGEKMPEIAQWSSSIAHALVDGGIWAMGGMHSQEAQAAKGFVSSLLDDYFKSPAVWPAIAKGAVRTGESAAGMGLLMGGAGGADWAIDQIGQMSAMPQFQDWIKANRNVWGEPTQWEEMRQRILDGMIQGTIFGGAMHGMTELGAGSFWLLDRGKRMRAEADMRMMDEVNQLAAQSKTAARSPEAFKEFIKSAIGEDQTVRVPVQALDAIGKPEEVLQKVPGIESQLEAARAVGGSVDVPVGNWFADVPLETRQALRNDVSIRKDGMTLNEHGELEQQQAELAAGSHHEYTTEDAERLARTADRRAVAADVEEKLKNAGIDEGDAKIYGALWGERYGSMAEQYGGSAMHWYQGSGLEVMQSELGQRYMEQSGWAEALGDEKDLGPVGILREDANNWVDKIVQGNAVREPAGEGGRLGPVLGSYKMLNQTIRSIERRKPGDATVRGLRAAYERLANATDLAEVQAAGQAMKEAIGLIVQHANNEVFGRRLLQRTHINQIGNWAYSALQHELSIMPERPHSATEWEGILANNPKIKKEEVDYRGLSEYLASRKQIEEGGAPNTYAEKNLEFAQQALAKWRQTNKGKPPQELLDSVNKAKADAIASRTQAAPKDVSKISRAEIMNFLEANPVKLKEKIYGHPGLNIVESFGRTDYAPIAGNARHQGYNIQGGTGYFEDVHILENAQLNSAEADYDRLTHEMATAERLQHEATTPIGRAQAFARYLELTQQRMRLRANLELAPTAIARVFGSTHSNEPNTIFWNRMDTRMTEAPGDTQPKRTLRIGESQGDWVQKAEDEGFASRADIRNEIAFKDELVENKQEQAQINRRYRPLVRELDAQIRDLKDAGGDTFELEQQLEQIKEERKAATTALKERQKEIQDKLDQIQNTPEPPIHTRESMATASIRRAMMLAVQNGMDRVSWDTGTIQAKRWGRLREHIETLRYNPDTHRLQAFRHGEASMPAYNMDVEPNRLGSHISNELKKRMLSAPRNARGFHELTGEDLTIGGQGYKDYYDSDMVHAANRDIREYGVRVKTLEMTVPEETKKGFAGNIPRSERIRVIAERVGQGSSSLPGYNNLPRSVVKTALEDTSRALDRGLNIDDAMQSAVRRQASVDQDTLKMAMAEQMGGTIEDIAQTFKQHYFDITEQMKNDLLTKGVAFWQQGPEGARARVTLSGQQRLVELFKGKFDETSFLHESAHIWLDQLMHESLRPDAPEALKEDVDKILDYFGVDHPDEISEAHHERWASEFERYLAEGKAPTPQLRSVFERIKQWMINVYKSLTNMGQKLDPKLHEFFDKMLTSDQQAKEAGLPPDQAEIVRDLQAEGPRRLDRVMTQLRGAETTPDGRNRAELMLNVVADSLREINQNHGLGAEALAAVDSARIAIQSGDVRGAARAIENAKGALEDLPPQGPPPREPEVHAALAGGLPSEGPAQRVLDAADEVKEAAHNSDAAMVGVANAAARKELWLQSLFRDAASAGMTKTEFKIYSENAEQAAGDLQKKAVTKARQQIAKRQTEDWKEKEKEIRVEARNDVAQRAAFRADDYFSKGLIEGKTVPPASRLKLDRDLVVSEYGEKSADAVPSYTFATKGGVDPDEIAELFGFKSGKTLLDGLAALEKRRSGSGLTDEAYRAREVEKLVQQRMEARYGILNQNILEEARGNVLGKVQSDLLADEVKYLARLANWKKPIDKEQFAADAREQLLKQPIDTARDTQRYIREAGKAGRAAEVALLKGDYLGAFQAKTKQLLNFHLVKASREFEKLGAQADKLVKKYSTKIDALGKGAQEYTDQIHGMLRDVGEKYPRTQQNLEDALKGGTIHEFIQKKVEEEGLNIPPAIYGNKPLKQMSAGEFSDFASTLISMDHVGKAQNILYRINEVESFEEKKQLILDNLNSIAKPNFDEWKKGKIPKVSAQLRTLNALMAMPERMMDWSDKGNSNGPFNTYVFRPLLNGLDDASGLHWVQDTERRIAKKLSKIDPGFKFNKKIDQDVLLNPFTGRSMDLDEGSLVSMILNWGTASNRAKLLGGWDWTEDQVQTLFDQFSRKEHWDYAQKIWDILEELKPLVARRTKSVSGIAVDLIDGMTIQTPHGEYFGKYFPLTEDKISRRNHERVTTKEPLEYQRWNMLPTTQARKARTGKIYPISLDLDALPSVLEDTIYYIGMVEPVANAWKIIKDPDVRVAFSRAFGSEYTSQLSSWLDAVARNGDMQSTAAQSWVSNLSRSGRANMIAYDIGLNGITAALHGSGALFNSIVETPVRGWKAFIGAGLKVPPSVFMSYWGKLFRNEDSMNNMINFVYSKSGEVRNRGHNVTDDIGRMWFQQMSGGKLSRIHAAWLQFNMTAVRALDQWSSVATWYATYNEFLKQGMEESDAIYRADKAVRNAHGSYSIVSKAPIQRGEEMMRWFTMFMGFFVNNYNMGRTTIRTAKGTMDLDSSFGSDSNLARMASVAARTMVLTGVMGYLHQYFRGHVKKDEGILSQMGEGLLTQMAGGFPFLRDVVQEAITGADFKSPLAQLVTNAAALPHDLWQLANDRKVSDNWVKHAMEFSIIIPRISGNITASEARAAQFLWDVHQGKAWPETWDEWRRGLMTGSMKERRE